MVTVDEPQGVHYGSSVAGPIRHDAMAAALRYLNVASSGAAMTGAAPASNSRMVVASALPEIPADENVMAVTDEESEPRTTMTERDELEKREIPDFTGLSIGEALILRARHASRSTSLDRMGRWTISRPWFCAARRTLSNFIFAIGIAIRIERDDWMRTSGFSVPTTASLMTEEGTSN